MDKIGFASPLPVMMLLADVFYKHLQDYIINLINSLKEDEALQVVYYDQAGHEYLVYDIGYYNPNLIVLHCIKPETSPGEKFHAMIHMQALQLVVEIVKKQDKTVKRQIGFLDDLNKSR